MASVVKGGVEASRKKSKKEQNEYFDRGKGEISHKQQKKKSKEQKIITQKKNMLKQKELKDRKRKKEKGQKEIFLSTLVLKEVEVEVVANQKVVLKHHVN